MTLLRWPSCNLAFFVFFSPPFLKSLDQTVISGNEATTVDPIENHEEFLRLACCGLPTQVSCPGGQPAMMVAKGAWEESIQRVEKESCDLMEKIGAASQVVLPSGEDAADNDNRYKYQLKLAFDPEGIEAQNEQLGHDRSHLQEHLSTATDIASEMSGKIMAEDGSFDASEGKKLFELLSSFYTDGVGEVDAIQKRNADDMIIIEALRNMRDVSADRDATCGVLQDPSVKAQCEKMDGYSRIDNSRLIVGGANGDSSAPGKLSSLAASLDPNFFLPRGGASTRSYSPTPSGNESNPTMASSTPDDTEVEEPIQGNFPPEPASSEPTPSPLPEDPLGRLSIRLDAPIPRR
uniref:Uncharacterized protein n=1 Tax=Chromera velia CCMP2878 TaxID=1169474 RepID=A0A0K6S756_9ALVE|eukprot:Cvel_19676.t2-p1 / transcript=Cvel_19676.t2 / gene=Cvel_19676 / organism=Chromera_velia_CCMP2878 / gene_product=hypothetical protein / transcript_product=hypothetical protein / location=Cvel_scaffold1715:35126-36320(-) / protein_length=348 / sequence_SO=supercontig / SO=protein_coding / is_pseudo=false